MHSTAPRAEINAPACILNAFLATFALAVALVFPAAATAGGAASPSGGAVFDKPPVAAPKGAFVGKIAQITGHVEAPSAQVAVDARLGAADWLPVGTATTDGDGDFSINWKAAKAGRYDIRVTPIGLASAAAAQQQGSLSVYRRQKATWYGPGFYGRRTACGSRLTRRTIGVAHRSLPCGTKVEFFNAGKKVVVPVIDRGPFVRGVTWDLTLPAMRRLGSTSTVVLGAVPLR